MKLSSQIFVQCFHFPNRLHEAQRCGVLLPGHRNWGVFERKDSESVEIWTVHGIDI